MRFPLLVLLALPGALRADDPPHLYAARERQKGGQGFEVTLAVRLEFLNVMQFARPPGVDRVVATGTANLIVEGEKFRYTVDVPVFDSERNELIRRREERAFDGTRLFVMTLSPDAGCDVFEGRPPRGWGDPFLPLEWMYRGTHTILSPVDGSGDRQAGPPEIKPSGREERIDGRRCVEVTRTIRRAAGRDEHESLWFDADRQYMPRKVRGVTIESERHPRFGWTPSGWTSVTGEVVTTVTVDSFEYRRMVPTDRFTIAFPAGTRVTRHSEAGKDELVAAEDGSLVPESGVPPAATPPESPSLPRTLAVVGGTVAVFVGLVVLLKRLARGPKPEPG